MITPNARSHMSSRDLMRHLAAESNATADHSHLVPLSPSARIHAAIKAYYIGQGNTEQQWQSVSASLSKFISCSSYFTRVL